MTELLPEKIGDITFSGLLIVIIVVAITWLIREWWPHWKETSKAREEREHDYAKSVHELNLKLSTALEKIDSLSVRLEQNNTDHTLLVERQRELLALLRSLYEICLNNSHNILSNYGRIELKLRDVINLIGHQRTER